eukprot:8826009-Lingulodinium_polyedra.AAC.1
MPTARAISRNSYRPADGLQGFHRAGTRTPLHLLCMAQTCRCKSRTRVRRGEAQDSNLQTGSRVLGPARARNPWWHSGR